MKTARTRSTGAATSDGARVRIAGAIVLAATLLPAGLAAQSTPGTTNSLTIPVVEVAPGDDFELPVEGSWLAPVKGFQLSIAFPVTAPVADIAITVEGTIVGDLDPDFVEFNVSMTQGSIVGGVLFETLPPFQGIEIPPVGMPLAIARITGTVPGTAVEDPVPFGFQNGLGTPPLNNTFIIGFDSVPPEQLEGGGLDIRHPPGPSNEQFVRGDVNRDSLVDISDVIFHLGYTFSGGPTPLCLDAGDANDDGHSDISDGIFVLMFLFNDGPTPWPPFPNPGIDFTPDSIGCAVGL